MFYSDFDLIINFLFLVLEYFFKMLKKPPVPKLWDSLKKYLSSLEPVLSKSQFEQTQKSVSNFLKEDGEGNNLQQLLKHFSNSRENWVNIDLLSYLHLIKHILIW